MQKRAFSLIELLIVILVIIVLMALLLPALSKSRDAAKNAGCLSNLRSINHTMLAHVTDYGYVPPPERAFDVTDETATLFVYMCPSDPVVDGSLDYDSRFVQGFYLTEFQLRLWTAEIENGRPYMFITYWDGWYPRNKLLHNNYAYYDGHVAYRGRNDVVEATK